jgi:hypothetical protein
MVIFSQRTTSRRKSRAAVTAELVVAIGILAGTLIPVSFGFLHEQKLCRAYYFRALAMEIVDGEMETLVAGGWRAFKPGVQPYTVRSEAAINLPPGQFTLTLTPGTARLEWSPAKHDRGGGVMREVRLAPLARKNGSGGSS